MPRWRRALRRALRQARERALGWSFGTVVGVDVDHLWLALTFDDGPHPVTTPLVLEVLARHGALATFFMVGREARRHPELVARVAAEGHAIGHHTLDHVSLPGLERSALRRQVLEGFAAVGPNCARLFRPPWGHLDLATWWVARSAGHEVIAWSGHPFDWQPQEPAELVSRLRASLEPGAIVLLHDAPQGGDAPTGPPRAALLVALDEVLGGADADWRFVTVPELLAAGRARRRVRWRTRPTASVPGRALKGSAEDGDAVTERTVPEGAPAADIAVVMPVLNAADTIAAQLEALARQTYAGRWELVLADNGCSDRSLEIARGLGDRIPLRIVDARGVQGAAHARNVGARATRAPLLAFVDADDVVADDWLAHIVAALRRFPAVASRFDKERLNPPELRATRNLAQSHGLGQHNYAAFLPHAGGSGLAVRRAVHEGIGGFDEHFLRLQDTDYCWRLQLAGHTLHYEPAALLHVRFRPPGVASMKQAFHYGRYNGHLYHRYRRHGMAHTPFVAGLKQVAVLLLKLPRVRDPVARAKRLRTCANLGGILFGRLEACLRRL